MVRKYSRWKGETKAEVEKKRNPEEDLATSEIYRNYAMIHHKNAVIGGESRDDFYRLIGADVCATLALKCARDLLPKEHQVTLDLELKLLNDNYASAVNSFFNREIGDELKQVREKYENKTTETPKTESNENQM